MTKSGIKLPKDLSVLLYLIIPGPIFLLKEWSEPRYWKKTSQTLPTWMDSTPLPNFVSSKAEILLLVSAIAASLATIWSALGFLYTSAKRLSTKKDSVEEEKEVSIPFTFRGVLYILAYQVIATFTLMYTDPGKLNNIGFLPKEVMPYLPFKTYPSSLTHVGLLGFCFVFFHVFSQYRPQLVLFVCELARRPAQALSLPRP